MNPRAWNTDPDPIPEPVFIPNATAVSDSVPEKNNSLKILRKGDFLVDKKGDLCYNKFNIAIIL